jgi:hypothetical protein
VVDKGSVPPSGDLHDYMSIAPYWWPDPSAPGGKPYVRKDGRVNPERAAADYDLSALSRMSADVETLALAYYFFGDRRYARHAATLLRTWFVDPQTPMKSNVELGQAVLGRANGRLDRAAHLPTLLHRGARRSVRGVAVVLRSVPRRWTTYPY